MKRLDLIKRALPAALVAGIVGLSLASSDSAAAKRQLRSTSLSSPSLASAKPNRPHCRPRKWNCADTTPPTAPTGLAVTGITQTGVSLTWNAATDNVGVTGYTFYLNGTKVGTAAQTSYSFLGLSCGTSYTLGVAAYDAAGNVSATATSRPTTSACSDTTRPTVPGGLSVTGTTQTGISLAWNAATDNVGVTGYALYLNGTKLGTTTQTTYTFSALSCGTSYTLGVAAYDGAGNLSSTASTVAASSACPDKTAPTAPGSLSVTATTQSGISLAWNAATDNVGVTGYALYVNGTKVGTTTQTTYTFSALSCGTSYTLGVAAYDAAGNLSSTPTVTAATYTCVASGPCGTAAASTPATLQHVVWIWMENQTYSSVIGNTSAAPYENQLAGQCGLATNYAGVAHPSLPNYIAATSGSTQGITDDNPPSSHPLAVASIFGQVNSKSYEESMPSKCYGSDSYPYSAHHNPEAYYTPVSSDCSANDVPMGSTSSGALLNDLANNTLPAFSFVTPNQCNNMHDCSISTGDAWLKSWVPKIIASPAYQAGQLALFITWDENDGSTGNHVPTIVASPYTPAGTTSATSFNHYSLLRTTEELLGTTNYLGNASSAASMRSAFFSPALVSPITLPPPPPPPPPSPAPSPSGTPLTWAPPANWQNYTPLNVGSGGDFTLDNSTDYKIVGATTSTRINLSGGRNIVIMGDNINVDAGYGTQTSTDNAGIKIGGSGPVGRIVHIEGVKIGGAALGDGIQVSDGGAIVQVENVYDTLSHGSESAVHSDCIQPWGGVGELRIDGYTCYNQYQGGMWKRDVGTPAYNGPIRLRRVNFRDSGGTSQYLSWVSNSGDSTLYTDGANGFWIQQAAGRSFAHSIWPDDSSSTPPLVAGDVNGTYATYPFLSGALGNQMWRNWDNTGAGQIRQGVPPAGDFVDPTEVGAGYVSPGYQS